MFTKYHASQNIPKQTAESVFAAIDKALTASSSTNAAELTRLCHRSLPFQQTTLALEVTRLGQSLDSYSMDKGSVAYMTGTCETRGLVFSIRISIFRL
ncbi:hypothetical protein CVIRNUC_004590 [Coccomyxa viridis]|uniref:Uncharacterized protein n=2 Tax=Coccomyxa viridis TaxID=1274662 RepID=A0AAV1I5Q7_9CHLO|nr:hypothetical protein CVIRNUC_004590 [Coccomyxa viridis]